MSPFTSQVAQTAASSTAEQLDLFALLAPRIRALAPPVRRDAEPRATVPTWPFEGTNPLAVETAEARAEAGALTASVFDAYRPSVRVPGACSHPTRLVESAAMAAATAPPSAYRPTLPEYLVTRGHLSDAQLETVCRAGSAHSEHLPGTGESAGPRQGFFLGDGTGVGKGRQSAAIILDNIFQGRRRAIWVSENRNLMRDAVRDWTALGGPADFVFDLGACKGPIPRADGVCFASYDTLKGKPREKDGVESGIDRLEQVVAWLAGGGEEADFEGVVVFDESHNASSALDTQGSRGVRKASQRALAVVDLQDRLPNARVVYASATGATEVANLAYAARLGLWGRGTPFPTVEAFVEKVSAGGIAAMELVAKDLKSMGLYLARSVSYDGVDYRTLVHDLEAHQAQTYDRCAEAWQVVLRNIQDALEVTKADKCGRARAAAYSQFWGAHQRFFLHVLVAMSAPSLIRDMEARLASGESCVVQLVSTMEAATERAYAKAVKNGEDLRDLDVTPRDQLLQFVEASFPTTLYEEYEDDDGRVRSRPVRSAAGDFVQSPEAVAARNRLMLEVGAVSVPHGVLDQVVAHFGPDAVAEVTGRGRRFVTKTVDGVEQTVEERRTRRTCNAEADEFMAGKRRVLVFSQAGGTGRSYHSDLAADNQQRRVLYCVEPGWSSARCVQGMGRVHRANQACPPELVLVTTNLKAQRRFLSTIARRLDQLGALTKGQRQTASQGLLSSEFNLETPLSRASLHNWFVDLYRGEGQAVASGVTPAIVEEQMGIKVLDQDGQLNVGAVPEVPKFLNRLLSLQTGAMDAVFDSWYGYLEEATEAAREAGTLDVGVETIRAERVVKTDERLVYTHERSGATTQVVTLELTRRTEIVDWDEIWRWAKDAQGLGTWAGFVVNRRSGQPYALFRAGSRTTETGRIVQRLRRVGVRSNRLMDETEIHKAGEEGGHRPIRPSRPESALGRGRARGARVHRRARPLGDRDDPAHLGPDRGAPEDLPRADRRRRAHDRAGRDAGASERDAQGSGRLWRPRGHHTRLAGGATAGGRRGRPRQRLAAPRAPRGERAPDRTRGAGLGRHARAGGRRGLRRGACLPHPVLRPDGRAGSGRPPGGDGAPSRGRDPRRDAEGRLSGARCEAPKAHARAALRKRRAAPALGRRSLGNPSLQDSCRDPCLALATSATGATDCSAGVCQSPTSMRTSRRRTRRATKPASPTGTASVR